MTTSSEAAHYRGKRDPEQEYQRVMAEMSPDSAMFWLETFWRAAYRKGRTAKEFAPESLEFLRDCGKIAGELYTEQHRAALNGLGEWPGDEPEAETATIDAPTEATA